MYFKELHDKIKNSRKEDLTPKEYQEMSLYFKSFKNTNFEIKQSLEKFLSDLDSEKSSFSTKNEAVLGVFALFQLEENETSQNENNNKIYEKSEVKSPNKATKPVSKPKDTKEMD